MNTTFNKISSTFYNLSKNKKLNNGIYLNAIMLFNSICDYYKNNLDEISVSEVNNKFNLLYGNKLNSASLSRNNAVLTKLGLIKLVESQNDRREKNILLTSFGHKLKSMFNQ